MDPDVLILDEPAAGLDPKGRDKLLSQIRRYHKARGNTVLLVSHSMEDIARVADRVLVMNGGKMAMLDETPKVFARGEELEKMGLMVPQVTRMMARLKQLGYPVRGDELTVEQAVEELSALYGKQAGMLSDITLGQFYPGKSLLHRMDPRMKLLLVVAVIVFIFVASTD